MKIKENLHMQIDTLKGAASAEYSRGVKDGAKAQPVELTDAAVAAALEAWFSDELAYAGMGVRMRAAVLAAQKGKV